ncbi:MAG: tetratricopeptide repeat protein [Methyloprofundus sp.]|nr:tetratricopeptide repeat protein [Methyloprofundus sp.]
MADTKKLLDFQDLNLRKNDMSMIDLEKSAKQGDQHAIRQLIKHYLPKVTFFSSNERDGDPAKALIWFKKLVELGDYEARHRLADCYFSGQYVDKADSEKAIDLLEESLEAGDYIACVRLAYYYSHGKGVEIDFPKAIKCLEKIVAYEDANPEFRPNQYFSIKQATIGTSKLCPEFTYYYEEPRYKLAELCLQGGFGIKKDFGKAVEWLEKAINWPNIPFEEKCRAQLTIGKCYLTEGLGVEKNYIKAIEWFKEIPEPTEQLKYDGSWGGGYCVTKEESYRRQAQRQLGICYALGKGVEQDFSEAKKYFEKAARTSSINTSDIPPMVDPRAEAELGVCHYQLGEIAEARQCYQRSAKNNDILGNLWLCYLGSVENDKSRYKIEYVDSLLRTTGNPFHKPSHDESQSKNIDKIEMEIGRRLTEIAVSVESKVRKEEELHLDMLDVSGNVIQYLKNRKDNYLSYPSKVILALYYQSINNEDSLKYLKELSDNRDVIADYHLGIYYRYSCRDEAERLLQRVASADLSYISKDNYPLDVLKELRYLAERDLNAIKLEKVNKQLDLEIKRKEAVEKRMQKLVEQFTHSLGNVIFPDTIYQVAERLKNLPECRHDTLLLHEAYHAEIIIKLQAELLRQRYSNTNPEKFRLMIRNCRRNTNGGEKTKTIKDILNYAVSRVTARFLNQHYAGLEAIRNKILIQTDTALNQLKQKFEDDILLDNCLSPLEWVSQNLRPIQITEISPLWQKVFFLADSYAEALLFGYFSEILFNAFKYADHDKQEEFLTLSFAEETINEDIYLSCNWSNPTTNQKLSGLGTNQGLEAIAEDLKQLNNTKKPEQSLLICQQDNQFQVTLFFKKDLLIDESNQLKIKRPVNRVEQT